MSKMSFKRMVVFSGFFLAGLGACTTQVLQPRFEQSNQMFLERTIEVMNIGALLSEALPARARLAVTSLELERSPDIPVVATIEDQIVSSLVGAGFTVLERDPEGVLQLIRENEVQGQHSLLFRNNLSGIRVTASTLSELKDPDLHLVARGTKLASAQFLLSYRILDVGLLYRRDLDRNDHVMREGRVRLHVRVTRAETG